MNFLPCVRLVPADAQCGQLRDPSHPIAGFGGISGGVGIIYGCFLGNAPFIATSTVLVCVSTSLGGRISVLAPWSHLGRNVEQMKENLKNLTNVEQQLKESEATLKKQTTHFEEQLETARTAKEHAEELLKQRLIELKNLTTELEKNEQTQSNLLQQAERVHSNEEKELGVFAHLMEQQHRNMGMLQQTTVHFERTLPTFANNLQNLRTYTEENYLKNEQLQQLIGTLKTKIDELSRENQLRNQYIEDLRVIQIQLRKDLEQVQALKTVLKPPTNVPFPSSPPSQTMT